MKRLFSFLIWLLLLTGPFAIRAQLPSLPNPQLLNNPAMTALFARLPGFSADMETAITISGASESIQFSSHIDYLNGATRVEVDTSKMTGNHVPAETMERIRQIGFAQMVLITQSGQDKMTILYPALKALAEINLGSGTATTGSASPPSQIQSRSIGNETVEGHRCSKKQGLNETFDH